MPKHLYIFLLTLTLCVSQVYADTIHYELAIAPVERETQKVEHLGYTLSWNADWNIPNWVAYELTADEVNNTVTGRSNKFRADPDVENSPTTNDYKNSGYDRGHMAPSADMRWSEQAMKECFYMTNMCPQLHDLNGFDWAYLEDKVRELALKYNSLYVCCGPIVDDTTKYIGTTRKILVPQRFYKVLLVHNNNEWHSIGFIMYQNDTNHTKSDLSQFACTVDEIERLTGIDFFHNLPDTTENRVEATYTFDFWR